MKIRNNRIAHRGAFNNIDIPENSLLAFKKAIDMKWDIELDVQLTKDNVLVVFHDEDLKRMTGISKKICDVDKYMKVYERYERLYDAVRDLI